MVVSVVKWAPNNICPLVQDGPRADKATHFGTDSHTRRLARPVSQPHSPAHWLQASVSFLFGHSTLPNSTTASMGCAIRGNIIVIYRIQRIAAPAAPTFTNASRSPTNDALLPPHMGRSRPSGSEEMKKKIHGIEHVSIHNIE